MSSVRRIVLLGPGAGADRCDFLVARAAAGSARFGCVAHADGAESAARRLAGQLAASVLHVPSPGRWTEASASAWLDGLAAGAGVDGRGTEEGEVTGCLAAVVPAEGLRSVAALALGEGASRRLGIGDEALLAIDWASPDETRDGTEAGARAPRAILVGLDLDWWPPPPPPRPSRYPGGPGAAHGDRAKG